MCPKLLPPLQPMLSPLPARLPAFECLPPTFTTQWRERTLMKQLPRPTPERALVTFFRRRVYAHQRPVVSAHKRPAGLQFILGGHVAALRLRCLD
jgi:hypothetical protein